MANNNLFDLIVNAKNGSEKDMSDLLDKFKPLLYKEASRFSDQMDEDCLQELMIAFFKAVMVFDPKKYK